MVTPPCVLNRSNKLQLKVLTVALHLPQDLLRAMVPLALVYQAGVHHPGQVTKPHHLAST